MLYSGQAADGSGDFISFGMRDRRAEFRLDVGSGPAVIASDPLELDQWYTARVTRRRKDGRYQNRKPRTDIPNRYTNTEY